MDCLYYNYRLEFITNYCFVTGITGRITIHNDSNSSVILMNGGVLRPHCTRIIETGATIKFPGLPPYFLTNDLPVLSASENSDTSNESYGDTE